MTAVFDGHNDLAWFIREEAGGDLSAAADAARSPFTTLEQLRTGPLGAQFWSVYVDSAIDGDAAVTATLEQIDIVRRLVHDHPDVFAWAPTASDIRSMLSAGDGRVASLLGAEGGQQINDSLAVLREYARLGVRYMTLTWSTTHSWADSATDEPRHGGLSAFGREVVDEMVRIGMIPDLSHVAPSVMRQVLDRVDKPVIFSHSCVAALNDHPRNVPTDVIDRLPENDGVLCITFVPSFVSPERRAWVEAGEHGQAPEVTVAQVADHCDWVRERVGARHVGLGGDLCGTDSMPTGLGDAGAYGALFAELERRGWTAEELDGLGHGNVLRVLEAYDENYLATVGRD